MNGARPPLLAYACLAASMALVGSYVGASRLLVAVLPVFLLAWLRFGIAAVAMAHWVRRRPGEPPLSPQDRRLLFWESFLGNFLFSVHQPHALRRAADLGGVGRRGDGGHPGSSGPAQPLVAGRAHQPPHPAGHRLRGGGHRGAGAGAGAGRQSAGHAIGRTGAARRRAAGPCAAAGRGVLRSRRTVTAGRRPAGPCAAAWPRFSAKRPMWSSASG